VTWLSLRFAGRELRSGARGFRIFLACLALGVAAIAAAGSTAEAFRRGLASQAGEILGGDLSLTREQTRFSAKERKAMSALGRTSWAVSTRAMAEAADGGRRLVELRGVSPEYPLAGKVEIRGAADLRTALARAPDGSYGAVVEQGLLDRLHLKIGDRVQVGQMPLTVRAVLLQEPDRLSRGFALGPRVMTSGAAVEAGGFLTSGLPFSETGRILLKPGSSLEAARAQVGKAFAKGDARIRDRNDAAPGIRRLVDQLEYFLGFIGLAALVAGGLGVHGAVSAYLASRTRSIAVLKALGADGDLIRNTYLLQISALAGLGVAIGLGIGAIAPLILGRRHCQGPACPGPVRRLSPTADQGRHIRCSVRCSLFPGALGAARATPPAALFRKTVEPGISLSFETLLAGLAGLGLAGLAIVTAPTPIAALVMIAGVALAFGLLWALGVLGAWAAGRLRVGTRGALRLALANLSGPGSAARTAAPAIGLGVALLAAVVLIQSSLLKQVAEIAPQTAPAMVFTEIPGEAAPEFDRAIASAFGVKLAPDIYLRAPIATGRIIQVRGKPVDVASIPRGERWAYERDISMSALGAEPPEFRNR